MEAEEDIVSRIRIAGQRRILFLPHALRQMMRPDRVIRTAEIRQVIADGEVVEDYPQDPRGHSCLLLGHGDRERPIHVVCAPTVEYLAIITAYLPEPRGVVQRFQKEGGEMKCIHCRGELKRGTTPVHLDRRGCHLTLDAVPAWICDQCGEACLEEREVLAIQDLVETVEQKNEAFVA